MVILFWEPETGGLQVHQVQLGDISNLTRPCFKIYKRERVIDPPTTGAIHCQGLIPSIFHTATQKAFSGEHIA